MDYFWAICHKCLENGGAPCQVHCVTELWNGGRQPKPRICHIQVNNSPGSSAEHPQYFMCFNHQGANLIPISSLNYSTLNGIWHNFYLLATIRTCIASRERIPSPPGSTIPIRALALWI